VEHILEGSVRKAGNELRITAQLVRATDGGHLWSKTYDKELKDIFKVQEDIATAVADELKVTLGIDSTAKMVGGTDNLKSYELYLVAQGQRYGDTYEAFSDALESLDAAIALDPGFALAWAKKAYMHIYRLITGPSKRDATEGNFALEAAQRAIELEPGLAEGHIALGWVKAWQGNLIEAEGQYRKALELRDDFLTGDDEYITTLYNSVGYFDRAFELFGKILRNDRLNPFIRGHYMLNLALRGDTKGAEEEYTRCRAAFGDLSWHDVVIMNIRLGTGKVLTKDDIVISDPIYDAAKKHLDSPEKAIAALRQLYSDADNLNYHDISSIASLAAYFGDPEFALDVHKNTGGANIYIFLPVNVRVRQLPRFKEFAREIGLVDYWNKFGWPDMCHQLNNGDFECD
jgi:tetratricopeptide (TPR) repeat protein